MSGVICENGRGCNFVDPGEHITAINNNGLTLEGLTQECFNRSSAISLTEMQSLARRAIDIAFICVKSYDTAWATMLIKDYLSPTGLRFSAELLNGNNNDIVGWNTLADFTWQKLKLQLN